MRNISIIILALYTLFGVGAITYFAIKSFLKAKNNVQIQSIEDSMNILSEDNEDSFHKAAAFLFLMQIEYILVHILVNTGNKYNDRFQTKRFCSSLTDVHMNRLKTLEGKDG